MCHFTKSMLIVLLMIDTNAVANPAFFVVPATTVPLPTTSRRLFKQP